MPTAAKMPDYLKIHQYQEPRNHKDSIFANAMGSEFWAYLSTHPDASTTFNTFMKLRREGRPSWFAPYPVEANLSLGLDTSPEAVLLVDVGGGHGHDLMMFKKSFPNHGGRLILQDQSAVISDSSADLEGIDCMAHDFFTPQPIHGKCESQGSIRSLTIRQARERVISAPSSTTGQMSNADVYLIMLLSP